MQWAVESFSVLENTQDAIRARLAEGRATEGLVIRALTQSRGRGRYGRSWLGGAGNLTFSLLLKSSSGAAAAGQIALLAGAATAKALLLFLRQPDVLRLKWPNDVLLGGCKCAGILAEAEGDFLILGIGINVETAPMAEATCLAAHAARAVEAEEVLGHWLGSFTEIYTMWQSQGFAPIQRLWLGFSAPPGTAVTVKAGAETLVGLFDGLGPDGSLLLKDPHTGARKTVTAGDVFL